MKARVGLAAGALAVVALGAWVLARGGPAPAPAPPSRPPATVPPPAAAASPAAPVGRNVFRFADEERAEARETGAAARHPVAPELPLAVPEPGPRLVGLVRRGERTVAALTDGGEVELAGPGESAAGVLVVAIDADGVRVRRPDGTESTLPLP